jgi:tRNA-dihydrouridine synthase B
LSGSGASTPSQTTQWQRQQPSRQLPADHCARLAVSTIGPPASNAQSGCGLLMTEFTSADGLARMRETKRRRYLTFYDDEHPIGAQLFGSNPETLADAARIVEETGFDTWT